MSLLKSIAYAVLGPVLIWTVLMGHLFYYTAFSTPNSVSVEDPIKDAKVISSRKSIVDDFYSALDGKISDMSQFLKDKMTADVHLEDTIQTFLGRDEFVRMWTWYGKNFACGEFRVEGEHHGRNVIVMEYQAVCRSILAPDFFRIPISFRSHVILKDEKVFKYHDEWMKMPLLSEENSTFKILGTIHRMLRRFNGYLLHNLATNG